MFDTVKIGRKIAELRKARNMTQFELADALGISFQAVSNWERGTSMPDISKLPELAEIFEVTIDEILGKKNPIIGQLVHDETIDPHTATSAEIEEAAMIAKPRQLEKIVEDNFDSLIDAVPSATVSELENKTTEANSTASGSLTHDVLNALLPYLDVDEVTHLAHRALENGKSVERFLPFIDEEAVNGLAQKAFEKGGTGAVRSYLPFMSDDAVDGMIAIAVQRGDDITPLLPFASEDAINACADEYVGQGRDAAMLLPYMNEKAVFSLAQLACRRGGARTLEKYMPFLSDDGIRQLMKEFSEE